MTTSRRLQLSAEECGTIGMAKRRRSRNIFNSKQPTDRAGKPDTRKSGRENKI